MLGCLRQTALQRQKGQLKVMGRVSSWQLVSWLGASSSSKGGDIALWAGYRVCHIKRTKTLNWLDGRLTALFAAALLLLLLIMLPHCTVVIAVWLTVHSFFEIHCSA
jgi:hypothetical protein